MSNSFIQFYFWNEVQVADSFNQVPGNPESEQIPILNTRKQIYLRLESTLFRTKFEVLMHFVELRC